jgi:hypothetical protein
MKRRITGLHGRLSLCSPQIPEGVFFFVRVQRVHFRRQAQKPYYTVTLTILRQPSSGSSAHAPAEIRFHCL